MAYKSSFLYRFESYSFSRYIMFEIKNFFSRINNSENEVFTKNLDFKDSFSQDVQTLKAYKDTVEDYGSSKMSSNKEGLLEELKNSSEVDGEIKSLMDAVDNIESSTFELASSDTEHYTNWYNLIYAAPDIQVYGQILYSYFLLHVLVAGLILLLVLIGVVYLTNSYKPKSTEQASFRQLSRRPK